MALTAPSMPAAGVCLPEHAGGRAGRYRAAAVCPGLGGEICDRQVHLIPTRIHAHSIDLEDVALHEVGHALCLQHQPVDSLMFPSIGSGRASTAWTTPRCSSTITHPDATVHLTCTTERKNAGLSLRF